MFLASAFFVDVERARARRAGGIPFLWSNPLNSNCSIDNSVLMKSPQSLSLFPKVNGSFPAAAAAASAYVRVYIQDIDCAILRVEKLDWGWLCLAWAGWLAAFTYT